MLPNLMPMLTAVQVTAGKAAAKREAAEREWRVLQVAGELARQADLLERHRNRVANKEATLQTKQAAEVWFAWLLQLCSASLQSMLPCLAACSCQPM